MTTLISSTLLRQTRGLFGKPGRRLSIQAMTEKTKMRWSHHLDGGEGEAGWLSLAA